MSWAAIKRATVRAAIAAARANRTPEQAAQDRLEEQAARAKREQIEFGKRARARVIRDMASAGYSRKEVAAKLNLNERTVREICAKFAIGFAWRAHHARVSIFVSDQNFRALIALAEDMNCGEADSLGELARVLLDQDATAARRVLSVKRRQRA